jgi:predicted  nucleic acid-binding Zn-ribbon protein
MKGDLKINLQGYPAANRDATLVLTNRETGKTLERKPYLDGTTVVRDLDAGLWDVELRHPNLVNPVRPLKPVRVFPQRTPTVITLPIPEKLFQDNPIRDVPDADLGPVQATLDNVRNQAEAAGNKSAGEAILAADWNRLTSAVADLATAVNELTKLVSPRGHDHPEIADKINEVQGNLVRFSEAYGKTLLELQREIEADNLREEAEDALAGVEEATRGPLIAKIDKLKDLVQKDPVQYTQQLSALGATLQTKVSEIAAEKGEPFTSRPSVQKMLERANTYADAGIQTKGSSELQIYQRSKSKTIKVGGK